MAYSVGREKQHGFFQTHYALRTTHYALLWCLALLCSGAPVYAQTAVTAQLDRQQAAVGEPFSLLVQVTGPVRMVDPPQLPPLPDMSVASTSRSQSIAIVNGVSSVESAFEFILVASRPGVKTIPPVRIRVDGMIFQTSPLTVEITSRPASNNPVVPSGPMTWGAPGPAPVVSTGDQDIFVKTEIDKPRAYVNEQITLTFKLFRRVRILTNPDYSPPKITGFWVQDLPPQRTYPETIGNQRYAVTELKTAMFATAPGRFRVGEAELEAVVERMVPLQNRPRRSILDGSFGVFGRSVGFSPQRVLLKTQPMDVEIMPLPDSAPGDFNGLVGRFEMEASIEPLKVKANEPVTMRLSIKGMGNIETAALPKVALPDHWRTFDASSSVHLTKENYRIQGEKLFEQVLVPDRPGTYTLGPWTFSFFDPQTQEYRRVSTGTSQVDVLPPDKEVILPVMPAVSVEPGKSAPKAISQEIRYIKTHSGIWRESPVSIHPIPRQWLIHVLAACLVLGVVAVRSLRRRKGGAGIDHRRPVAVAELELKKSAQALRQKSADQFFGHIAEAFTQYMAVRTGRSAARVARQDSVEALKNAGASEGMIEDFDKLLDRCDAVRFAAFADKPEEMQGVLNDAKSLLKRLERLSWQKR